MNADLTAVHNWSKLSDKDEETMRQNWEKETDLETLQNQGKVFKTEHVTNTIVDVRCKHVIYLW